MRGLFWIAFASAVGNVLGAVLMAIDRNWWATIWAICSVFWALNAALLIRFGKGDDQRLY